MDKYFTIRDTIIIGSGSAGWTASIYAKRGGLDTLVITGNQVGGQLTTTTMVENYTGFPNGIDGNELMNNMKNQAINTGVDIVYDEVVSVSLNTYPYIVTTHNDSFFTRTVIIATGASHKYLGIEGEQENMNNMVHYCATCDGFFYRNKSVAVIGGGDTACEEALFLSNICKDVTILVRGNKMKASHAMQDKIKKDNISIVYNWDTQKITGFEDRIHLDSKDQGVFYHAVFVAVGIEPNVSIFKDKVELTKEGYIKTDGTKTNIPGVFACGDVQDSIYRQAIVSAGSGCMAAMDTIEYCSNTKFVGWQGMKGHIGIQGETVNTIDSIYVDPYDPKLINEKKEELINLIDKTFNKQYLKSKWGL